MPDTPVNPSAALPFPSPAISGASDVEPSGDQWFRDAVARWEKPVLRFALSRAPDVETARDAAQDTFVRLLRHRPSGTTEELGRWLITVCRNRITDLRERDQRLVPMPERDCGDEVADESAMAPFAAIEQRETAQRLHNLIAALPARERELVQLRFMAGLRYREIAAATGLTVSNVGCLLHHAIQSLRDQWSAET